MSSLEIKPAPSGGKDCSSCKSGSCGAGVSRSNSTVSRPMTPQAEPVIDTIYKACAYGDVDKLRHFVETEPSLVNQPDPQGFHALQWGALNNRVAVCSYLIENNAEVNAVDGSGQTALHWAGVRGSLSAAEVLLRANAQIEICDSRGYTVSHVAAQYGQTAFLYHLALQWSANIERPDKDGRTCLHWAAYKGFGDLVRLLVFMDAAIDRKDKEGCTPLHWAAIVGNGEAATLLLQGGSADLLEHRDVTGSTPAELASEKGHRFLGMHLKEWREKHLDGGIFGKKGALRWVTALQLCPVIWAIILGLLTMFTFCIVNSPAFPPPTATTGLWAHAVLVSSFTGLYFLYKTTTSDPGFLPKGSSGSYRIRSTGSDDENIDGKQGRSDVMSSAFDNPALRAGQWQQLCVTCKIVRPLRAKHCAMTDRCVEHFDHFCPWVGNCIGKGNRHYFFIFLVLETLAILISLAIAATRLHAYGGHSHGLRVVGMTLPIIFIIFDFFMLLSVTALTVAQGTQIARNVTTNEMANWNRYKYLKKADGSFRNPFDRGIISNCLEVLLPGTHSRPSVSMMEDPMDPIEAGRLLGRSN